MAKLAIVSHLAGTDQVSETTPTTTVVDASGNGHNGVLSGSYIQGVGGLVPGDAALFQSGYPGSVTVPNVLDLNGDWTMTGWINPTLDPFPFSPNYAGGLVYGSAGDNFFGGPGFNQYADFNAIFQSTSTPGFYWWMQKVNAAGQQYLIQFNSSPTFDAAPAGAHMWAITFTKDTSTVYSHDSFNRGVSFSTLLGGSQTDGHGTLDPLTWSTVYTPRTPFTGSAELITIGSTTGGTNGAVAQQNGTLYSIGTVQIGTPNVFITVVLGIAYLGGIESGIVFRFTDINNFWYLSSEGGDLMLNKVVGGTKTQVGRVFLDFQEQFEEDMLISVETSGSSITATAYYMNTGSSTGGNFHRDTRTISVSDGFNSGATRHGVMCGNFVYPGGFGNSASLTDLRIGTKPLGSTSFYIDGELINKIEIGMDLLDHNAFWSLGAEDFFNDQFVNGPMSTLHIGSLIAGLAGPAIRDETAFFSRALSDGDIAGLYAARGSFAGYSSAVLGLGPASYYHLDEVPTTVITQPAVPAQAAIRVIDTNTGAHLAEHDPTLYEPGDIRYIRKQPLIAIVKR